MRNKRNSGVTLAEIIIVIGIMGIVFTAAAIMLHPTLEGYANDVKLMEDQYNTRMALLSIVREVRYDVNVVTPASGTSDSLVISTPTGTVTYSLVGGRLVRAGASDVFFVEVELDSFSVTRNGRWLTIDVAGSNGMLKISTKVSLNRIPD